MENGKRIRLVFKDDDILSETQKLEGLSRSWVLLKPHYHDAVSDLASHLLHAFQLHQSCPHGILLYKSGFVLPLFESTSILKDNEIISVRKRKDVLSIEGKDATDDARRLKALGKEPVNGGVLLLSNEEFEKETGGYESDEPEEESEEDGEILFEVVENSSGANANKRNRKRKATESLPCNKDKKQRSEVKHSGKTSSDLCKGTTEDCSVVGVSVENIDEPAYDVAGAGVKRTVDAQGKDKEIDDAKTATKETKKVPSRSSRRTYAKRHLLKELAKLQKQNDTCESEGLQNRKEDQAKADRKKSSGQLKGLKMRKKNIADAESNEADEQPKGLLHLKLSSPSPNKLLVKGKKHKRRQNCDFLELPNQNCDVHKQQNQNGDKHEQLTQMVETSEQPNHNLDEQLGQNSAAGQEHTDQNCDTANQSHESAEENEVLPIEIRPGHIRFEPLEEEEQSIQQRHAPLENFNWNGISSKKKGQQWGKENHRFTSRNDYKANKWNSETPTKEKEKTPSVIDFDKLPLLPGIPKEGDLIVYRILELSSTWTPEMSAHRVGKVSCYNNESDQMILLPVPEYPLVSEKDDGDEASQPDNSLYKDDGSLEIDLSSLIDVRILTNGRSEPGNNGVTCFNEASTSNANALKTTLPCNHDKPRAEPSTDTLKSKQGKEMQPPTAETRGSIWEQLSASINEKKEQLAKENGWNSTPKKVAVYHNVKKLQPPHESDKKPQPLEGKQSVTGAGSRSWSYKSLRGSGLGPTMAWLRSKKDT